MRALWLEDRRLHVREDVPIPEPPSGEALVRVLRAGICNTDIELTHGYYPFTGIPGHEFVGVVERGPSALVGRRVVGEINAVCGACGACLAGRRTHCERRTVLGIVSRHGAFADHLILPAENLHAVPDGVSTDAAVFTEPLAAALEIQEQVPIGARDRVLVVGDGKLGQLVAQTLALTGCALLVVGRHDAKLALLAARGIETGRADRAARGEFDVAVECTGNPEGFAVAQRAVRPRGTLVLKSTYAGALTLDAAAVVVNELTLVGSRCGPFAPALRLLAEGRVAVAPLIHARYRLAEALTAFEDAQRPGVLKVLLEMEAGCSSRGSEASEQRDVEPGVELERGPVVVQRPAFHVRMRVSETRLEPAQKIPARVGRAHTTGAGAEDVDSTAHVELQGSTRVEPELQVAIEPHE